MNNMNFEKTKTSQP